MSASVASSPSRPDSKSNLPGPPRRFEDEIDLMDLFVILWNGRWIILGLNVIAALVGFLVIQPLPGVYRVEAVLAGPSQYKLQVLQPSILQKARAADSVRDYQVASLVPKDIYIAALAEIDSLSLKRQYWEAEGRALARGEFDNGDGHEGLRAFARSLQLSKPQTIAGVNTLVELSFFTADPETGVDLLTRYLAFAERQIINRQISQLQLGLQASLARLEKDYASLVAHEKVRMTDELIRLQEAHGVAAALGIVDLPYDKFENIWISLLDDRHYLLGTAMLGEEIDALHAREEKPLEAFVPYLRQMGQWRAQILRDMRRLEAAESVVEAFDIIAAPEPSLGPVKPNKPLLLVAVVFATFIMSVFLVFVRHGWRSYRARTI